MTARPVTERRRELVTIWIAAAVLFGLLLWIARSTESGLDDTDPAWQRPGFLDAGPLPQPAAPLTEDRPRIGRPAVVFFVRPSGVAQLCRSLARHHLGEWADEVMVVSGNGRCQGVATVEDPSAGLADAYGMRRPRDGGSAVGYAVVDRQGRIRYRTLDPTTAEELGEVDTLLGAVP